MEGRSMKFIVKHKLAIFILIFSLFNLVTLRYYPVAGVDESWQSSNSYSIFNKDFVSINYPFFLQNTGVPYLMNFLLGLDYKIFGLGIIQGRMLILLLSTVFLLVFYGFTQEFFGKKAAFLAVIYLTSTRAFLLFSHFIRNEVLLMIFLMFSLWCFFRYLKKKKLFYLFLSGLILGASNEIHQNGLFFILALVTSWVLISKSLKILFSRKFFTFFLGIICYSIYYLFAHVLPNIPSFLSERKYSILNDHALPILSLPIKELIISELNRYFSYFYPIRIFELCIIIISIIWSLKQRSQYVRFIIFFITAVFVQFFFFATNKTEAYLIYFFVLFSILIANLFLKLFNSIIYVFLVPQKKDSGFFSTKFIYLYIFLIAFNFLTSMGVIYSYRSYDYSKVSRIVFPLIKDDSLILGPTNYFLPLKHLRYRSFYVLPWFRIFKGYNTKRSIEEIRPEYIIVDNQVEQMLEDNENNISDKLFYKNLYKISKREFNDFLNNNTSLLIKYNSDYLNNFRLYKVNYD